MEHSNETPLNYTTFINPQYINGLVDIEMKHMKEAYSRKEQEYVDHMLAENPIKLNCYTKKNHQQQSNSEDEVDVEHVSDTEEQQNVRLLQPQQAETRRRYRINDKIKIAKSKYRHTYVANTLLHSTQNYKDILNRIAEAEKGISRAVVQNLRHSFGIEEEDIDSRRKLDEN